MQVTIVTYEDFKRAIKEDQKIPYYYNTLAHFTEDILVDISIRNQNRVAADLGMTSVKFSHLLPMLKEMYQLSNEEL